MFGNKFPYPAYSQSAWRKAAAEGPFVARGRREVRRNGRRCSFAGDEEEWPETVFAQRIRLTSESVDIEAAEPSIVRAATRELLAALP